MVSSEVQRTLVKSPPELWAEISDPESLARHLGEFGEIRITRVHPEQRVEWETNDARGTVAIKPSGWGTKVKLTVTRELSPAAEEATPVAAEETSPPASEEDLEAGPAAALQAERALSAEADSDNALADAAPADGVLAGDAVVESLVTVDLPDEDDVAAVALARDGIEETAAETAEDAESAPPDHAAQAPGEWSSEPAEPELREPRRGFFARLFGRGRGARPAPRGLDETGLPSEPDEATAHEQLDRPTADADRQADTTQTGERALVQPFAAHSTEASAAALQDEPLAALTAAPIAPWLAPVAESNAAEDARFEERHEHLAAIGDPLVEPPGEASAQDAAEAKGAEEVAIEQVTAVLTGVLDRLGAAHHRPFSRS